MSKVKVKVRNTGNGKRGRPFRVAVEAVPLPDPKFSFDDYYNALVAADEILGRCGISYVCRGNTLDVITGDSPNFNGPLTLATLKTQITEYAMSALKQLTNPTLKLKDGELNEIILPMGIIEVEIKVLDGDYRPIKNFDLKYFNYDVWKIPNPITEFNRIMKEIYG